MASIGLGERGLVAVPKGHPITLPNNIAKMQRHKGTKILKKKITKYKITKYKVYGVWYGVWYTV